MTRLDLMDYISAPRAPRFNINGITAGYKEPTTSQDAALSIESSGRAALLRQRVLEALRESQPMTADEISAYIGVSVLYGRPRVAEMNRAGLVHDTGLRRKNVSGMSAKAWTR